jgi:sugar lactone lactonase YvrE
MKKIKWFFVYAFAFVLVLYLLAWPVPIEPVSWNVPVWSGYEGAHAVNDRLASVKVISLGEDSQPEHLLIAEDGMLYTSVTRGNILRMNPDGSGQEIYANTGGRPLGLDFDTAGNMIVADAHRGLLLISPDRKVTVLTDKVDGDPIRFADAVVIAGNGKIFFSDATTRFSARDGIVGGGPDDVSTLDIIENSATGRILEFDPGVGVTRIVARGFSFANGVALSSDEKSLFVAETGRYRVWKIDVAAHDLVIAQDSPQASVVLDNLPGFPDNLMRGLEGKIWVGIPGPRSAALDRFADAPFIRKLFMRLPKFMGPSPVHYGHVIAFSEDGEVVADLQDPTGAFPKITGVTETVDRFYFHNLNNQGLGWLPH